MSLFFAKVEKLVNVSICCSHPGGLRSSVLQFHSARVLALLGILCFFLQQLQLNEWLAICVSFVLGPEPSDCLEAVRKPCVWGLTYLQP